ncbi:ribonucleotide reductase of class III [Enterococcus phage TJE2]|uniref:Ribonucleotide reductase of class III n=1 Tax=Enterococcus phage TJE2 TaxID=2951263 RepID=A0A976SXY6_9CAUD|nr:ribonucleotide reductase of class III [Enterococcus phage TJE2]
MQATQDVDVKTKQIFVVKRDGRTVKFNEGRIVRAVGRAEKDATGAKTDLGEIIAERVKRFVVKHYSDTGRVDIAKLQSIVEQELMKSFAKNVARNYIEFRSLRDAERAGDTDINVRLRKLQEKDKTIVNENANKDSNTFATERDLTAGTVNKVEGLKMLPPHVANAHLRGDIHYHDLDYQPYRPMTNCCLIDFEYMLKNGFKMGNAEIGAPHSIQTATAQTAQIIANVASSQYGGCSFDRIDEVLAPYAEMNYQKHMADAKRYRIPEPETYAIEKTNKDIYDAMQSLEYEINTLFTSNGQTPFTSIGFGLGTGRWEREIQKAIFKVRIQGLGTEGRTAIFPKLLFTIKDGVNRKPEDPNYEVKQLALECSAKRMYPDILNYDKIVELTGSFKCPMGCRSFLQGWKDEHGNEVNSGRMNLGVVTLNLPRIAIESEGDKEVFWEIFEERAKVLHDALVYRIERTYEAQPKNAPILYKHGAFGANLTDDDDVKQLFINNRATVSMGYIGLYEVASMFYGGDWQDKTDPHHEEAKEFALDVLRKLYDKKDEWTKETGIWFSIYSTPSESLTDRFCRMDTEKYGVIENITDKEYYTNSFHYDVRKAPTPFEKIDFEKEFPKYASGGFIHYVEYPKLVHNLKALEAVWDYSYDKVGYLGTNTPIDKCHECGFDGEFNPTSDGYECPQCGNNDPATCDVVKRQCGYLGQPQARPNAHGRKKEIDARVKHM